LKLKLRSFYHFASSRKQTYLLV